MPTRSRRSVPRSTSSWRARCFAEAATLLHDGLVLDELDDHDQHLVVQALCDDLVAPDPGAALRARAALVRAEPASWHDPDEAWSVLLTTVGLFQL